MRVVGGMHKGRRFSPPANMKARPTTDFAKEALFNVLENISHIAQATVLDLFCGSGGISLEFSSRGAKQIVAIDVDPLSKAFIEKTTAKWGVENIRVVKADVFKVLKKPKGSFDFVFVDPPYADPRFATLPKTILEGGLVREGGWLIIEHSKSTNFAHEPHFHSHKIYGSVNFSFFQYQP